MNPDSQHFEYMPTRQLSLSDCSPGIGSDEAPKGSRGIFFVLEVLAPQSKYCVTFHL